jgi:hypothetical protein
MCVNSISLGAFVYFIPQRSKDQIIDTHEKRVKIGNICFGVIAVPKLIFHCIISSKAPPVSSMYVGVHTNCPLLLLEFK